MTDSPIARDQENQKARQLKALLIHNPAFAVSLVYLLCNALGFFYSYHLLKQFNVNALDHLELNDFLLGLLSNPQPFKFFILSIVALLIDHYYHSSLRNRWTFVKRTAAWFNESLPKLVHFFKKLNRPFGERRTLETIIIILYLALWVNTAAEAQFQAERIKTEKINLYQVTAIYPTSDEKNKLYLGELQLVISTTRYLWLYDKDQDSLQMIPNHNIASLVPINNTDGQIEENEQLTEKEATKAENNE